MLIKNFVLREKGRVAAGALGSGLRFYIGVGGEKDRGLYVDDLCGGNVCLGNVIKKKLGGPVALVGDLFVDNSGDGPPFQTGYALRKTVVADKLYLAGQTQLLQDLTGHYGMPGADGIDGIEIRMFG